MKIQITIVISLAYLLMISVSAFGQEEQKLRAPKRIGSCSEFTRQIITPDPNVDYKMVLIITPQDLDKKMVINPCKEESTIALSVPVTILQNQQPEPLIPAMRRLRFNFEHYPISTRELQKRLNQPEEKSKIPR